MSVDGLVPFSHLNYLPGSFWISELSLTSKKEKVKFGKHYILHSAKGKWYQIPLVLFMGGQTKRLRHQAIFSMDTNIQLT